MGRRELGILKDSSTFNDGPKFPALKMKFLMENGKSLICFFFFVQLIFSIISQSGIYSLGGANVSTNATYAPITWCISCDFHLHWHMNATVVMVGVCVLIILRWFKHNRIHIFFQLNLVLEPSDHPSHIRIN